MADPLVLPDLSIRQLEYLVAMADAPTWATAAGELGVSPSALSQGLAELERRVGIDLFESSGRRRVLRPAAQPVLDHARHVVALTGDLVRWADRVRAGDQGDLRVGMIDVAAVHHFADVLRIFRDTHPDLGLRLRVAPSGALLDELAGGGLDVVVCVAPPSPSPRVRTSALFSEQLAVYRPGTKRPGQPSTWGPWVLFPEESHTRALIADALRDVGATVDVVAESNQPEVLREMVTLGMGWTVLPIVQAESGPNPLARRRALVQRQLISAVRVDAINAPAVDAFVAAVQSAAAQMRS